MIQNHIVPRLGQKRLADLTTADIQRLCNALRQGGRLIPANPTDGVQLPKRRRTQKQILNDEQLNVLMKAIEGDEDWHDFFYTELTTGLRRGEIYALRWEDFDELEGPLHVRRTLKRENGALVCGDTKTYAGRRVILLPLSTAELLRERKKSAVTEWVFPNALHSDQPMNPATAYDHMKRILKRAGLPDIRFHDLRHTFATLALQNGVDIKTVSEMLGHYSAGFTLDTYTHVTTPAQIEAANTMGNVLAVGI